VVKRGIEILLPPLFEILEPGRLSISGETERAEGGYGVPRWVRAPKRFFKGGKRPGELVLSLAAMAAGHELRFLRNCQQTLLQLSRGLALSTIDLDCRALPRQTASTEKPRAGVPRAIANRLTLSTWYGGWGGLRRLWESDQNV
jgi:hypothetical protein